MSPIDYISVACYVAGAFFFVAGTVGVLRFPDVYTRLHALTKSDGLGLGFVFAFPVPGVSELERGALRTGPIAPQASTSERGRPHRERQLRVCPA